MADASTAETMLLGLDTSIYRVLKAVFDYVLKDIRFGRPDNQTACKNFGGGFFQGTTHATANAEFSIVHNFGRVPYLAMPVLPLDTANSGTVRVYVSKAADANRVYLYSPDQSKSFMLYIEG